MEILCGGILDGCTSVWSHALSVDCLDPTPCGRLSGQLLQAVLVGSSSASLNNVRHVAYPSLSDMRRVMLAPINFGNTNANSTTMSAAAAAMTDEPGASAGSSAPFTAFSPDMAKQILAESEEYVKGEDKLCTSAAFVFHRIPPVNGSGGNGANSRSTNLGNAIISSSSPAPVVVVENNNNNNTSNSQATNVDRVVTLWLCCRLAPEVGSTINSPARILDLANAATILARWSELCLREVNFGKQVAGVVTALDGERRRKWHDNSLAHAAVSLDECAGEFGDCRHAGLELRFAE